MMTTFRKTAKGVQEIGTRAYRLPPRLRQLLVMVDGQRSDDDFARLLPDSSTLLSTLAEGEFIEAVPGSAAGRPAVAPVAAAASAPAPASAPVPQAVNFPQARAQAVRALTDAAGPLAEGLALKMERAANAQELAPWLERAVQLVAQVRGADAAEAFARQAGLR